MNSINTQDTVQLQQIEQQLNHLRMHAQSLRSKELELNSAYNALDNATESFRAIGSILVHKNPAALQTELQTEKEDIAARVQKLESQIESLQQQKTELQDKLMKSMQGENSE